MPGAPILYFDNNATTRPDPRVVEAMLPWLGEAYGNPSTSSGLGPSTGSGLGKEAARAVARAREAVAALLRCEPGEIVFTSGGTESNHTALASALQLNPERRHLVTTAVEHRAILAPFEALEARGYEVTRLGVDAKGALDLEELERALRPGTALVSVMAANNETGVLFPLEAVGRIARERGVLFHTDAVQAVGKEPLDPGAVQASYLSASAHKFHGPKGIGLLYVNRRCGFEPLFRGGGQEHRRRAGTENVAGIVGLGRAAELALEHLGGESVRALRDRFEREILERVPGAAVNGDPERRLGNTSNLAFEGIEAQSALVLLDRAGVSVSAGSACTTGSRAPSHVLQAMGCSEVRARGSLRFSFSRFNTAEETARLADLVAGAVAKLRAI